MASKHSTNCMVTVTIELGHQANFLKERSPEGFTHEWTVFVRGYEGSRIEHFVDKVVFKLHKTFRCPVRTLPKPPYKVTECGYAGFHLPIEIHFKNKQSPRKIPFTYDLFLNALETPPINNIRYEKLKFQNPTPEFKAKLLKAGGVEHGSGSEVVQPPPFSDFLGSPPKTIPEKKSKSSNPEKEKHKKVKKVKKSDSLPSLSPSTSDEEVEKPSKGWLPQTHLKKETSVKKELPNLDTKIKIKHESLSSHKASKQVADKEGGKDREKSSSTSHHNKDAIKKEKEHKSHKSKGKDSSYEKHKEREGSHSSIKSSSSSHGDKSLTHSDKKNSSLSSSSSREKLSSKEKDREKENEESNKKHKSSHKSKEKGDKPEKSKHKKLKESLDGGEEQYRKSKDSSGKSSSNSKPSSSEKDKSAKPSSHKRPSTSPPLEEEPEKKKVKRSSSVGSEETAIISKSSGSSEKDKTSSSSRSSSSKDKSEVKSKDSSKSSNKSLPSSKTGRPTEKVKDTTSHPAQNDSKSTKPSKDTTSHGSGHSRVAPTTTTTPITTPTTSKHKDKIPKLTKSDSLTKAEQLAMTADFQPQLLLSPVRSQSEDDHSPVMDSSTSNPKAKKRRKSNNSLSSLSSAEESDMSENEGEEKVVKPKQLVSVLVDSDNSDDSDGEEENGRRRRQAQPPKPPGSKHNSSSNSQSNHSHNSSSNSSNSSGKSKKGSDSSFQDDDEKSKRNNSSLSKSGAGDTTKGSKSELSKNITVIEKASETKNGLDILAPNGLPVGDLISINDKLELAQDNDEVELINKVVDIIADTGNFDLDEIALSFDICSLEKHLVAQIQNLLRD